MEKCLEAHKHNDIYLATSAEVKSEHRSTKLLLVVGAKFKHNFWSVSGHGLDQFALACRLIFLKAFNSAQYWLLHHHHVSCLMDIQLQNYACKVIVHRTMIWVILSYKVLNYMSQRNSTTRYTAINISFNITRSVKNSESLLLCIFS